MIGQLDKRKIEGRVGAVGYEDNGDQRRVIKTESGQNVSCNVPQPFPWFLDTGGCARRGGMHLLANGAGPLGRTSTAKAAPGCSAIGIRSCGAAEGR